MGTNNELLQKIDDGYARFSKGQKKLADYIRRDYDKAAFLTAARMGEVVGVSESTVVRFAKAVGYKSFREFKYAMMQEEMRERTEGREEELGLYGFRLSSKDRLEEIPGKIVTTSIQMLEETLKSIRKKEFERAVDAILAADNIVIYGVENSLCTVNDLLTKLTYLGLNCRTYTDYYLQNVSAGNLTKKDLAIGVSYSGYSRNTVEVMRAAKKAGARTLVLTNFENALIAKYADILLCASHRQFFYGDTIFSRISQLALVDMLYAGALNRNYPVLSKKLKKTNEIVTRRAYREEDL